ncbi:hypothetical protein L2E82_01296 [Cichorium intybus]|uniref:Uncharacterized protein n=1 Tax=Cichorium intybus TaxID=13427 RepID=A0ACB9GYJ2_CICIN|nr:hypothetical protein L2E82_01296 [Cichorium intybus]
MKFTSAGDGDKEVVVLLLHISYTSNRCQSSIIKKLIWVLKVILGSVNMYGKSGTLEDARNMFDNMPKRNLLTWNSMMVAHSQNRMHEEAIHVFHDMRIEGIQPTIISISVYAIKEGKEGHAISIVNVKIFFESLCGEVYRLRLLGDYNYSTRIAFVDFVMCKREGFAQKIKDEEGEGLLLLEGFAQKIKDEEGEGCNIYGSLEVNKVAGNFHCIKSFHQSSIHIPDLLAFQEDSYNVGYHRSKKFTFLPLRRRLTSNGVVIGLIVTNVAVFLLWRVVDCKFMMQNFMIDAHILGMTEVPKDLTVGTIGGAAQLIVGHPFDTIKVKLQSQTAEQRKEEWETF